MTDKESRKIMHAWPRMTKDDIRQANALFRHYLFFDAKGDVTASCCGGRVTLNPQALGGHREQSFCPVCGSPAMWYGKRFGKKNLTEYVPAMFLHQRTKSVYAQTFWMRRAYTDTLTPKTEFKLTYSYRLRPGAAEMWENWSWYDTPNKAYLITDWFKRHYAPLRDKTGNVAYHVIGLDALKGTHLEYVGVGDCQYEDGMCYDLTKRLMLACYYPIEMLEKLGLKCFVDGLMHGVTNQEIIDYTQTDPRKALGLSGAELKQLAPFTYKIDLLRLRKRLQKRGYALGIADCADLLLLCKNDYCKLIRTVEKTGVSPLKLRRYLAGQVNACGRACMGGKVNGREADREGGLGRFDTRGAAWEHYVDYLNFCEDLQEDTRDRLVAFPRDLDAAHNEMARRAAAVAQEIQLEKDAKLLEKRKKEMSRRKEKYSFAYNGYVILLPMLESEIIAEGSALRHCVGGYADRHISGQTTILFLRRADAPDMPLATIEMNGNVLVQVHGYRNDLQACPENPERIPARKLYGEVLDVWLQWLKRGSPRNKDGTPRVPRKQEAKTA